MSSSGQYLESIKFIIDSAGEEYNNGAAISNKRLIPYPENIPQRNNSWVRIDGVISVFVDMTGSTKLSATRHEKSTAEIYQYFTGTMVKIFKNFGASYIDVKGDGVFALFNYNQPHTALCAAITCKTFCENEFSRRVFRKRKLSIGSHIGIDQKTVLVKRIGLEPRGGDDSHLRNEVWAGKPVNMSAKLASLSECGKIVASSRFFSNITNRKAKESCGCNNSGISTPLWEEMNLEDNDNFDFAKAMVLRSLWCEEHGKQYCRELVSQESE